MMTTFGQVGFGNEALEKLFVKESEAGGLINLAGHRSVGGCRASIYNGMPLNGVESLVEFMKVRSYDIKSKLS